MTRRRRAIGWLTARPSVVDGIVAALFLLVSVAALVDNRAPEHRAPNALAYLLTVLSTAPLAWRRRRPLLAIVPVVAGTVTYEVIGFADHPMNAFAVLLSLYAVGAYAERKAALWVLAGTAVAVGIVLAENWEPDADPGDAIGNYVVFGTAWVLGDAMRQRRERIVALEERAVMAERTREEAVSRAAAAERTRIARELHDVVAHGVSVMVVQAGAARRVLQRDEPDPDAAVQALESVEATGRESLNELRRLLGVLRRDDDRSFGRVPQPSLSAVDMLVEQSRDAGLDVTLIVDGEVPALAAGVDLTAYRIVQEALTNALKHAGPDARAEVHVRYSGGELEIAVSDDGRGADGERNGAGHGLVGMAERVSLFGGRLHVGNRPGGGFLVRASLPLETA